MTQTTDTLLDRTGRWLASRLQAESSGYEPYTPSDPETLRRTLEPGDVLLVEGNQRISAVIKYLTQSTWSHATLFIGDALTSRAEADGNPMLVEVDLSAGCIAVPLTKYTQYTTRICRPVGLTDEDRRKVVDFMIARLGFRYDMRNVVDLARYLHPMPFLPVRWRRRIIALGSGEPTRAICSTLIAEAFQGLHYPFCR